MSSMNQPNQMWHYPGSVDTVSTGLKINGVHTHGSMVVERFELRIVGDEQKLMKSSRLGCSEVA